MILEEDFINTLHVLGDFNGNKTICGIYSYSCIKLSDLWSKTTCLKCLKKAIKLYPKNNFLPYYYKQLKYKKDFEKLVG